MGKNELSGVKGAEKQVIPGTVQALSKKYC